MAALLLCRVVGRAACLGGRLEVVRVDGKAARRGGRGLEDGLGELVAEAMEARARRREGSTDRDAPSSIGRLRGRGSDRISPNDMKGLVGEIVAEAVLVECGYGEPFYSKWRHGGTSTSRGIDIVLLKGGTLSANESKHLHALRPGGDASRAVSAAIVASFRQNGDHHTRTWLVWLRRQCIRAERLGGAMRAAQPPCAGSLARAIEIIDKALSAPSVPVNAVAVFDARCSADAESIRDRLGPSALRGTAAAADAVAAAIDGLHGATASLMRRHC